MQIIKRLIVLSSILLLIALISIEGYHNLSVPSNEEIQADILNYYLDAQKTQREYNQYIKTEGIGVKRDI